MLPIDLTFRAADNLRIFAQGWEIPDPKAVVVVVHGYGEHSGRYNHVIDALNAGGYSAYALDHRGHGRSEGMRALFNTFDDPLRDLRQFVDAIHVRNPQRSIYMLGHSMGALLTWGYVIGHAETLAGFISSAAPLHADANVSPLLVRVGALLNNVIPTVPLLKLIGTETLSRDASVVAAYEADSLNYHANMRVRMGHNLNLTAKAVRERLGEIYLPVLILHGEDDQLVNISGSREGFAHIGAVDKTLKTYPHLYHEIMNEPERDTVLGDMLAWLDARTLGI